MPNTPPYGLRKGLHYRHPALVLRGIRLGAVQGVAHIFPMASRIRIQTLHRVARFRVQPEDIHHRLVRIADGFQRVRLARHVDARSVALRVTRLKTDVRVIHPPDRHSSSSSSPLGMLVLTMSPNNPLLYGSALS